MDQPTEDQCNHKFCIHGSFIFFCVLETKRAADFFPAETTQTPAPQTLREKTHDAPEPSHVVSHIYGVQLVGQKSISEVHALLLPSGVNGDDAGVHYHHHPHDEVVLLQDNVGDQGHQVQGLLLRSLQLHHHHEEVCPSEDGADSISGRLHMATFTLQPKVVLTARGESPKSLKIFEKD
ncbi:unnamed protein product [Menidia menidia]|uniref:(Atlantic silverside) hypothetical protein n=1 Tax=Menidia menidia TaxID=238744 RepID=A0A8S4AMS7_9TELE|nr:unnamed protein product [Menidia menidia]